MMKKLLKLLLSGAMVFILNGVGFGGEYTFVSVDKGWWGNDTDDIYDLEHSKAYSWEIDMSGTEYDSDNEVITSMVLTFTDIYDTSSDANNRIYLSVLDTAGVDDNNNNTLDWDGNESVQNADIDIYSDSDNGYVNYFRTNASSGTGAVSELYEIKNISTTNYNKNDIAITFTPGTSGTVTIVTKDNTSTTTNTVSSSTVENLFAWAKDGIFELGFDPDCHFNNTGISLMIYTSDSMDASHAPEPETLVLFGLGLLGASAFGRKRFSSMG